MASDTGCVLICRVLESQVAAGGTHSVVLTREGHVDVAAGGWHSTALTDDGEVYGWGRGEHGRLGFGDNDKSSKMVPQKVHLLAGEDIVQVSCGGTHSAALTRDGHIFSYGRGDHGRLGYGRKVTTGHPMEVPIELPPPENVSDSEADGHWIAKLIASGGRHTLAIVEWKADGITENGVGADEITENGDAADEITENGDAADEITENGGA